MALKALVLHPYVKRGGLARSPEARLEEAIGLARAIELDIADSLTVAMNVVTPATLIGKGKAAEIAERIKALEIGLAVIDHPVSPVQQQNLEKLWNCKVIDRTALILEIFGERARTAEGKLQVELAALEYQKGRLVRSWTHLERQRGGFGFLGGPGESQIEIDRRLIRDRIAKLKKELETTVRTRELHRKQRRETPYPTVALVGYTNAGKSTLFNRLTGAEVLAQDKLFATLDPTLRQLTLPSGLRSILSDTVGFVSDLPHELVAAFRATLEEVVEAEIILHVRDLAHPDTQEQKADVEAVLKRLFGSDTLPENVIEIGNKVDLLPEHERPLGGISAITGEGLDGLLAMLDKRFGERYRQKAHFALPLSDGRLLAWLHAHGKVLAEVEEGEYRMVDAELTEANIARFRHLLSGV